MPNDVKAVLSVALLVVAAVLAYWSGSPIRPEFSTFVMISAVLMVAAMWVFPEAGGKKQNRPR
jgi:hypothetical protein